MEQHIDTEQQETVASGEELQSRPLWSRISDRFSLEIFVSNIPFMLFVAALGAIYITNNSKAADLVRALDRKNKELKELRWEYADVQSRLIFSTSESELARKLGPDGLYPLEKPAFEIKNTTVIETED